MNRILIHSAFLLVLLADMNACQNRTDGVEDLSSYVNPFIGTSVKADTEQSFNSMGKTFPGAATPFGMTQVSPNTITGGDNGSGYGYQHKTIEGFAFTQMSGIGWYGDLGNFLVMPTTGELHVVAGKESDPEKKGYRSEYDKASEAASAGYYTARLTKYDILTEATASPHGGALRFTYPASDLSRIQIDLARRVGETSTTQYVEVVNDNTIRGWMKCTPEGGGWGDGYGNPDYTVFFYAEFSKPLDNYGFWSADIPDDWERKRENVLSDNYQARIAQSSIIRGKKSLEGKHVGFFAEFPTTDQEEVTLKAGISFSDLEGAEKNFKAELQGQTFDGMKKQAKELWNKELSKILMEGGTHDEKVAFYTALYHTMIDPRNMTDVDGRYPGGDHQIHQTADFTKRTIFSGWDVFRSQFPLQTIINPTLVNDEINSLVTLAEESGKGYLERWEFFNAYSGCMVGNPAISVLADAYAKNIRKYDIEKAYRAAVRTSELIGNKEELGYTPVEKGYSISETLEYAYTDWCVAQLAKALGKTDDAEKYTRKSLYYKNIFDSEDKMWFRPKRESGAWEEWPANGRLTEWHGSIESNPYQQGWFVPHDIDGMVALMGGEEKVLNDRTQILKFNSMIRNENERMNKYVERILLQAKLDRREVHLKKVPVNLNVLVDEAVEHFRLQVEEKGGVIRAELDPEGYVISADEVHMLNVVCNLIDNAIKYSHDSLNIYIYTKQEGNRFIIGVRDTGIGIPKEAQDKVFKRFYRVPSGNVHNVKGFGLGLSYAKSIVELHGGEIQLTSKKNKGTQVEIIFKMES